ncbi:hypothetical protein AX16_002614 [Volvariella volvacea WC 439]|nr:hypothetical protein AX16_002614 [Volvariella volvacea WC 439]
MKKELDNQDHNLDIAMKVGTGIAGIGFLAGVSSATVSIIFQRKLITTTFQAVATGLMKILAGDVLKGVGLMQAAGRILKSVLKGEALSGKVASVFKVLKVAGTVLSVLGIALDAIMLIYEAIDGAKQREEFQQAIKDLCVRRFTTKKIQQYVRVTLQCTSDAKAIVDYAQSMQDFVVDDLLEQAVVDAKVQQKMTALEATMTKAIGEIDDNTIYKSLQDQDRESNIAWTNEDPSLAQVLAIIDAELEKS